MVAVEATADTPAAAVLGRIALGPGTVEAPTDRDAAWRCGPLTVKFFDTFGTGSVERVPQYARAPETWWPGVQLRQNLDGGAKSGQRFVYSVWIGPQGASPRPPCVYSPKTAAGSPPGLPAAKQPPFSTPPPRR